VGLEVVWHSWIPCLLPGKLELALGGDTILLGFRFLWHKEVFDFAHIVAEQTKGSSYWVPIIFAGFVAAG